MELHRGKLFINVRLLVLIQNRHQTVIKSLVVILRAITKKVT